MHDKIRREILAVFETQKFDMLDIRLVQNYALEQKMYDLLVYTNNHLSDYVSFVKMLKSNKESR